MRSDSGTRIRYFNPDAFRSSYQPDRSCGAVGVPMDIRSTLLNDTEDRDLQIIWKPAKLWTYLQRDFDATALGESIRIPCKRGGQADLVEQRGCNK